MAYDWENNADKEGGSQAERLPDGIHDVKITRVVFGKKDGPAFASRSGDPQIMIIYTDAEGREAGSMVTLSPKAGWVLAKILRAAGANLSKMTSNGVKPADFAAEEFATVNLVGRELRVNVEWTMVPNGKDYVDVMPVTTGANQQAAPAEPKGPIPF